MSQTRREVLAGIMGFTASLAGCSISTSSDNTQTESQTPVFQDLSIYGLPDCPQAKEKFQSVTPEPIVMPASPESRESAVERASRIETAFAENQVYLTYEPLSHISTDGRTSKTADADKYPEVKLDFEAREVLQNIDRNWVVHLQYTRYLDDEIEKRYTVNYYISGHNAARAEAEGFESPGPHPTEEGTLLNCWEGDHPSYPTSTP
jgi:hypothetical protein